MIRVIIPGQQEALVFPRARTWAPPDDQKGGHWWELLGDEDDGVVASISDQGVVITTDPQVHWSRLTND